MSKEMHEVLLYLSAFFMVFLSIAILCLCLRVLLWVFMDFWVPQRNLRRRNRRILRQERLRRGMLNRQGNIFTISDDNSANNVANRYADFFYLEPNSEEAARIRAQLEKDDKDLPSYDEVMRINNITTPTAAAATSFGASTTSIATTDTMLTVPPYSEVDPNPLTPIYAPPPVTTLTAPTGECTPHTAINNTEIAPSTSRAAAAAAASSVVVSIPIGNSVSNSNV